MQASRIFPRVRMHPSLAPPTNHTRMRTREKIRLACETRNASNAIYRAYYRVIITRRLHNVQPPLVHVHSLKSHASRSHAFSHGSAEKVIGRAGASLWKRPGTASSLEFGVWRLEFDAWRRYRAWRRQVTHARAMYIYVAS